MARHGKAIGAANVDDVLADYSEESVVMSPGRTARGLSEIRVLFSDLFTDLIPFGTKLDVTWHATDDEHVFVVWTGESERQRFPMGTDTFGEGKYAELCAEGHSFSPLDLENFLLELASELT